MDLTCRNRCAKWSHGQHLSGVRKLKALGETMMITGLNQAVQSLDRRFDQLFENLKYKLYLFITRNMPRKLIII